MTFDRSRGLALLPIGSAIGVLALFVVFYNLLDIGLPTADVDLAPQQVVVERWKILWGVSALCLGIALIWNFATAVVILRASMHQYSPGARNFWLIFIGVANIVGWLMLSRHHVGGGATQYFIEQLDSTGVPMTRIKTIGNMIAFSTVSVMVLSICTLVVREPEQHVSALARKLSFFAASLYGAAGLLVSGLFQIYSLLRWSAANDHVPVTGLLELRVNTIVLAAGILFSALLFAVYTPIAIVQRHWIGEATTVESSRAENLDVAKWQEANGLTASPLVAIGAMLSPVAGALAANISTLLA